MQRVCFTLQIKPDHIDEYKRLHEDVWPEMLDALSRHGWRNYSLFLKPGGMLIGYCETPDFAAAIAGMQDEEVNARWQERVKHLFEPLPGDNPDTSMKPLEEVFHLD